MKSVGYAAIAALLIPPGAAFAQDATDKRVAEMMANARDAYAIPKKPSRCEESAVGNEIVVCAPDHSEEYRVPNATDQGSTDLGIPHADVGTHAGVGGVTTRGCFLQKCPKPVYLIDLSKIPQAPPGSDADKIAKGEMAAP